LKVLTFATVLTVVNHDPPSELLGFGIASALNEWDCGKEEDPASGRSRS
jgi:hypothetical protein